MMRLPFYFVITFTLLSSCKNPIPKVNLANTADPDIVLVNIENGDREFIGKLLMKIDSLKPLLVGIDVFFSGRKSLKEDSILIQALHKLDNDILCYSLSDDNQNKNSDTSFTKYASDVGLLKFDRTLGLISNMTPLLSVDNKLQESFAYKIVKHWMPEFKSDIKPNQEIPINYQRTLEKYLHFDGSLLLDNNTDIFDLKNKIFLVGYIGPGKEDKHSTPLRFVGKELNHDEPDTYGLVIVANQIRTILEYKK